MSEASAMTMHEVAAGRPRPPLSPHHHPSESQVLSIVLSSSQLSRFLYFTCFPCPSPSSSTCLGSPSHLPVIIPPRSSWPFSPGFRSCVTMIFFPLRHFSTTNPPYPSSDSKLKHRLFSSITTLHIYISPLRNHVFPSPPDAYSCVVPPPFRASF